MNILGMQGLGIPASWFRGSNSVPFDLAAEVAAIFADGTLAGSFYGIQPQVGGAQVLWQDEAGTVPAVADGDPVLRVDDLSGQGGAPLTSPVGAILRADGQGWELEFDGSTHYFDLPPDLLVSVESAYIGFTGRYRQLESTDRSIVWFSTGASNSNTRARLNTRATDWLQTAGRRLDSDGFDTGAQAELISQNLRFTASGRLDYMNATAELYFNQQEAAVDTEFSTPGVTDSTNSLESYVGWQSTGYTAMSAKAIVVVTGDLSKADALDSVLARML